MRVRASCYGKAVRRNVHVTERGGEEYAIEERVLQNRLEAFAPHLDDVLDGDGHLRSKATASIFAAGTSDQAAPVRPVPHRTARDARDTPWPCPRRKRAEEPCARPSAGRLARLLRMKSRGRKRNPPPPR